MTVHSLQRARVSLTIRTTPERAFDAWLDPALARQFMAGGADQRVAVFETDPREGGAFRVDMTDGQRTLVHEGQYVVIDRPNRLVFTWISAGTDLRLSLVSITFTAVAGGVRLDLEHEGIPDDARAAGHVRGWTAILTKLQSLQEARA